MKAACNTIYVDVTDTKGNPDMSMNLKLIEPEEATGTTKEVLEQQRAQIGFVPNMYKAMANVPALLQTYLGGMAVFRKESTFSAVEQEVIFLIISRENGCDYCVAAHSTLADTVSAVPRPVTEAIRSRTVIPDSKLESLSHFVQAMLSSRGNPSEQELERFLNASYSEKQILEIVLAISIKTLSNYGNHLLKTPVDNAFAARTWSD